MVFIEHGTAAVTGKAVLTCRSTAKTKNTAAVIGKAILGTSGGVGALIVDETDIIWCGSVDNRMELLRNRFSTTVLSSQELGSGAAYSFSDITFDGVDVYLSASGPDKFMKWSGVFSTTIKDSFSSGAETTPTGISWDGANFITCGSVQDKLKVHQLFSSVILDSRSVTSTDGNPSSVVWDGTNTDWVGTNSDKIYKQQGRIGAVILNSFSVLTTDTNMFGIGYCDGDMLGAGDASNRLYVFKDFSSTVITQTAQVLGDTTPTGIEVFKLSTRLGYDPSVLLKTGAAVVGKANVELFSYVVHGRRVGRGTVTGKALLACGSLSKHKETGTCTATSKAAVTCRAALKTKNRAAVIGKAVVTSAGTTKLGGAAAIIGRAVLAAAGVNNQESGAGTAIGRAVVSANAPRQHLFRESAQVTAKAQIFCQEQVYSKTSVTSGHDFTSTSVLKLTVSGSIIDFTSPRFQLDKYTATYDGKTLEFSEIPNSLYSQPSFPLESWVTLQMDLSGIGSLTTYFRGKIKNRAHDGYFQQEKIRYTAFGVMQLSKEVGNIGVATRVSSPQGSPCEGATLSNVNGAPYLIQQALSYLPNSIPSTLFASVGFDILDEPAQNLQLNGSVFEVTQQLSNYPYGARILFKDRPGRWELFRPIQSDLTKLYISSLEVQPHTFTIDTQGRATHITLVECPTIADKCLQEQVIVTNVLLHPFGWTGSTGFDFFAQPNDEPTLRLFTPSFVPSYVSNGEIQVAVQAAQINLEHIFLGSELIVEQDECGKVIDTRLYSYSVTAQSVTYQDTQGEISFLGGYVGTAIQDYLPNTEVFQPTAMFITLTEPLITTGDITDAQHLLTASDLGYFPRATISYPIYSYPARAQYNWPPSGQYAGTAYTSFGNTTTRIEYVPSGKGSVEEAFRRHQLYKDVLASGELVVTGEPLLDFFDLDKRVVLSSGLPNSATTPIESYPGILSQFTYEFGKVGRNNLSFSSDVVPYLR